MEKGPTNKNHNKGGDMKNRKMIVVKILLTFVVVFAFAFQAQAETYKLDKRLTAELISVKERSV